MFDAFFTALAWLLSFFYSLIPNYAVAIALLTVAVFALLFPVMAKAVRSQAAMTKLQPELKRIQTKYKDDPQEQNAQVMALFKEHGATPFGCLLPLIVQGVVLMIMYRVLLGLTHRDEDGFFDPRYLDHSSKLYQDLRESTEMVSFGIDLAETASDALRVSFVAALPFLALIAASIGLGYYQQWMMTRRNPGQAAAMADNPMAKQMQTMTRVMPLMYLVFGFTLPAGINVYFVVSSIFRIVQQAIIYRMHPELLPGSGSQPTASSRDVTPPKEAAKARANGQSSSSPPSASAARPTATSSRRKKKKRR